MTCNIYNDILMSLIYLRFIWETIDLKYIILAQMLVTFVTIETKSNPKKKKKIISHNQECKKIMEGYFHFYFIKIIFAFFSRHETYLFIFVTILYNF